MEKSKCDELRQLVGVDKCLRLSDHDMHRFLVARNFIMKKAASMVDDYLKWYVTPIKGMGEATPEHILDTEETAESLLRWKTHFPFRYSGHDKTGCPVYWERSGHISATFSEAKKHTTEDEMVWHHVLKQEFVMRYRLPRASQIFGREVTQQVIVMDLAGMSFAVDTMALSYITRSISVDQANYPERLKCFMVINCPWFFTTIWALITPFIDPNTKNKFLLLGADYQEKLLEMIDSSQVPASLGGERDDFLWDSDPRSQDSEELMAKAVAGTVPPAAVAAAAPAPADAPIEA
jgi:hypothetical protein